MKQIAELLAFKTNVQLAHWQADSRTNDHATLGKLYEQLDEQVDLYTETVLGKAGTREIEASNIVLTAKADYSELLKAGLDTVAAACAEFKQGEDDDVRNILADITGAINHAKYLLNL